MTYTAYRRPEKVPDHICPDRPRAPGVRGSALDERLMSAQPVALLVSVGRPGLPEPMVSRAARRSSAATLDNIGYDL